MTVRASNGLVGRTGQGPVVELGGVRDAGGVLPDPGTEGPLPEHDTRSWQTGHRGQDLTCQGKVTGDMEGRPHGEKGLPQVEGSVGL